MEQFIEQLIPPVPPRPMPAYRLSGYSRRRAEMPVTPGISHRKIHDSPLADASAASIAAGTSSWILPPR